jgi:hypothetical protein
MSASGLLELIIEVNSDGGTGSTSQIFCYIFSSYFREFSHISYKQTKANQSVYFNSEIHLVSSITD